MIKHLNESTEIMRKYLMALMAQKVDIVSICYSWFQKYWSGSSRPNPPNITEILEGKQDWEVLPSSLLSKTGSWILQSHDKGS